MNPDSLSAFLPLNYKMMNVTYKTGYLFYNKLAVKFENDVL
jgi:hypothetical protein